MASNEWLVRKLHEQDKKIEALSRGGTGVGHTSIAPGENLTVISDNGEVVLGAGGVEHVDGPAPATPSAPTLKLGFGTIETTWDGTFAEGEDEDGVPLTAPVDFDVVEVHCSTDPEEEEWGEDTMRGQIKTREGGTITVGGFDVDDEVFVCLIALAKTGKRSAPSATSSLIIEGLDFAQLTNELDAATVTIGNAREVLLDGQNTLGEKLDAADTALSDLETTLGELDSTTLPALRSDLDAAEGRLSTAEGQITDAFGEIADARSDAATDATAKADAAEADAKSAAQQYDTALKGQIDTTINQAKADLTADINAVRTSADGKNTVTWSTSTPPTSYSGAVNDTWFVMSGAGSGATVLSQWRWNGNVWVSTKLSQAVLAQIDIGTGTFGEMDGARLKAGSIYADRIVSGLSQNMVPDPGFVNPAINTARLTSARGYGDGNFSILNGVLTISTTGTATGHPNMSLSANDDLYAWSAYPAMKVVAKAQARMASGTGQIVMVIRYKLRDGTLGSAAMGSYVTIGSPWTEYAWNYALSQDVASFSIVLQVNRTTSNGVIEFRSPFVASAVGTTVIEPGAVTTDRLAANVLEVGNLKAGTAAIAEAVVAKIAASTASIQQADVKNLFVTGTSSLSDVVAERIAAETAEFIELEVGNLVAGTGTMDTATINKLFADVVVASMAQAQEFIGENAILTGAVTAPKITASEELWAKIAEFVQIRAEHIEADAIDGMVITGATIRSAATGSRVQLSASGIESYNDANERTFYAEASSGNVYMVGSFYSNDEGQPRVEIDNDDWADIGVPDENGDTHYTNGSGIRIGSNASAGFSIYHGSYAPPEDPDAIEGQAAVIEGPLGKTHVALLGYGDAYIGAQRTDGAKAGRLYAFGNGDAAGYGYDSAGVRRSRIHAGQNGAAELTSYSSDGSVSTFVQAGTDHAGIQTMDAAGVASTVMRGYTNGNVDIQASGSVNVGVSYGTGGRFRVNSVWGVTSSSGSIVRVNSDGTLFRDGSSERYKQDIADAPVVADILNITPRVWREKSAVESSERLAKFRETVEIGPVPRELGDAMQAAPWHFGAVAEELHSLGLTQFVQYDEYNRPDGIDYDRIGVALIPIVRDLRDRITELERLTNG